MWVKPKPVSSRTFWEVLRENNYFVLERHLIPASVLTKKLVRGGNKSGQYRILLKAKNLMVALADSEADMLKHWTTLEVLVLKTLDVDEELLFKIKGTRVRNDIVIFHRHVSKPIPISSFVQPLQGNLKLKNSWKSLRLKPVRNSCNSPRTTLGHGLNFPAKFYNPINSNWHFNASQKEGNHCQGQANKKGQEGCRRGQRGDNIEIVVRYRTLVKIDLYYEFCLTLLEQQ